MKGINPNTEGVKKEDLSLTVHEGTLFLKGKRECRKNQDPFVNYQRCCGEFEKEIDLPHGISTEKAESSLSDGVLEVKFPKITTSPSSVPN